MPPRISVVMSVHNGEQYLAEAVDSILNQTFQDFEFIVIDDGSRDSTPSLLAGYQRRHARIQIHRFEQNRGLSSALNFGIRLARGEYIARMDADDISLPTRFEKQVAFMDANLDVGMCGSWITDMGRTKVWQYQVEHESIRSRLLFGGLFCHPSVVFRRSAVIGHGLFYDERVIFAQDYELWTRVCNRVRVANFPEALIQYRMKDSKGSSIHELERRKFVQGICQNLILELGLPVSRDILNLHEHVMFLEFFSDIRSLRRVEAWLVKLRNANRSKMLYARSSFEREINSRWTVFVNNARRIGVHPWHILFLLLGSSLLYNEKTDSKNRVAFFLDLFKSGLKALFKSIASAFFPEKP